MKSKKAAEPVALKSADDSAPIKTEPLGINAETEGNAASTSSSAGIEAGGESQQAKMLADLSLGLGSEAGSAVRLSSVKQSRETTMGGVAKVPLFLFFLFLLFFFLELILTCLL